MNTRNRPAMRKASFSIVAIIPSVILVLLATAPHTSADKPRAKALVTDRVNLPLSNLFGPPNQFVLSAAGEVLFTSGNNTALFRSTGGVKTRLLQSGDSHPGFANSTIEDFVAANLAMNGLGHAAMTNFFVQKGVRPSRGVFVFDGTSFNKVAFGGEVAPGSGGNSFFNFMQLRINDSDQVAFRARLEPPGIGPLGLFIGSPTAAPAKIALPGEAAPGTGGGTFVTFNLIGVNIAGQVAWISNIAGGTTPRAIFVGTPSSISKVAAIGDPAPGTTGTFAGLPNNAALYFLNNSGGVAFAAGVSGGGPTTNGIWVGDDSGPPTKLVVNTDPTGTTLGGNFGGGMRVHGFNNTGKVLFRSNPDSGASSSHALFLKDLANPAQVVFARGQAAPGGTTENLDFTAQASLNASGDVAFLAQLSGGPSPMGWFLGSGTAAPVKIALEGEATPAGGSFGLAGRNTPGRINSSGQVLFAGDIIGPNAVGVFRFTPGFGVVAVMTTSENLPSGASSIVNAGQPGASDDQLVFYAQKAGGRSNVFTKPLHPGGGGITRRVGEGDPAPVAGGALWNIDPFFGLINNSEEVAFTAGSIVGGSPYPTSGIFTHKPGTGTRKIVTAGDPAPGGGTLTDAFLAETHPRINSSGQVVFFSDLDTGDFGIFIGSATGGVQKIVRTGDPSPIGPGTIVDAFPFDVESNDSGQVAFGATIETPGPVFTNVLFVGSGTSAPMKVVAVGDPGPGGSSVSQIGTFFRINSLGEVGYLAELSGGSAPSGVFIGGAGGPQSAVALAGSAAPGTGGGTFSSFVDFDIDVNSLSNVSFFASIAGSSATGGYFVGSASVSPSARLIEGQSLPGGGSVGVISALGTTNLLNSGELSLQLFNIVGAPNLFRLVVISPAGIVSELARDGDKAAGTGSSFGESVAAVPSATQDRLVFSAVMVGGPTKFAIFSDK